MSPDVAHDAQQLAVLLGTPLGVAADVLDRVGGLDGLLRHDAAALGALPGIGTRRAARLAAALWVGRRALTPRPDPRSPVNDANAAHAVLSPALTGLVEEELHALYLDKRNRVLAHRRLTVGSDRFTVVDARQIFRPAVALGAPAVILGHNHPSGDASPSVQDRDVTRRVSAAGRVLGIALLDHLIIGHPGWSSLRQLGDMPPIDAGTATWMS